MSQCQEMIKQIVNRYHHVRINQLHRLAVCFGLQNDFRSSISKLRNSGCYDVCSKSVSLKNNDFSYVADMMDSTDKQQVLKGLEKAFVVLTDFVTEVSIITHFPVYRFPHVLVFATDTEVYEIMYVGKGRERIAGQIMRFKDEDPGQDALAPDMEPATKRIVIIDSVDQMKKIHISNIFSFALVNEDAGYTDYYPVSSPPMSEVFEVPVAITE